MAENPLTPDELAHQAKQHLQSLQDAGVEWLPKGDPLASAPANFSGEAVDASGDLFVPEPLPDLSLEQRRVELDVLIEQVAGCSRCSELYSTRTQTVFGDGPFDPELCFIGEAPGRDEDQQGIPFVGAAGQLLNRIIAACGFQREEVYICNILRCRPPGNRTPTAEEAGHCREYLDKTLDLIRPKYICALGACAAQNLLETTQYLGRLRRRFHDYNGITVMCTYHPAYLLRTPEKKREVWEDMQMLLRHMGRPIPDPKAKGG